MAKKTSDKLSYGIILLIFGVLFLLNKLGVLAKIPYGMEFISTAALFGIAGVVFLICQPRRFLGWVFLSIAILMKAHYIFGKVGEYSYLLLPIGLIVAGVTMILSNKK